MNSKLEKLRESRVKMKFLPFFGAIFIALFLGCANTSKVSNSGNALEERGPIYPSKPLKEGVEGFAEVQYVVDTSGLTVDISILQEVPEGYGFGEAAVNFVSGLKFKPATLNGKVVRQKQKRKFNWELSKSKR